MAELTGKNTYLKFIGQCTECGHCREACSSLSCAGMNLGQIAKRMLELQRQAGEDADPAALAAAISHDPSLVQAVRGCFFCTSCQQTCFAHNDVAELIYAARVDFQNLGLIPREAWSSVLVDQEWDIFTAYRAIWGIGYLDLTKHLETAYGPAESDCEVAFFPGCALAAYGPELTREVFSTIEELGGKTTMIDHCCGSPLKSAGFYDRAEALCQRIADEIAASGAKTIVCACPGCKNAMKATMAKAGLDVEATTVSEYLLQKGFTPKRDCTGLPMCFTKSCQDRDGSCLDATRALLGAPEDQTSVFHGCCGAGGAVSAFNYARGDQQADEKLSFAKDGEMVVTMCPTCTYTYAFRLMSAPRAVGNCNYLELMFLNGFDWNKVSSQLNSMWTGQYGPWLASIF